MQVETAIPVFIGYTERAGAGTKNLLNVPTRIDSLKDFEENYGRAFLQPFILAEPDTPVPATENLGVPSVSITFRKDRQRQFSLRPTGDGQNPLFYLYPSIRLFYQNGGATCYIVSVGSYEEKRVALTSDFTTALEALIYEQDPTLVVCPDALRLSEANYYAVATQQLAHCADVQSRMAIFDVYRGATAQMSELNGADSPIEAFRAGIGQNFLNYGVAYFPWVNTMVMGDAEVTFRNLEAATLVLLRDTLNPATPQTGATEVRVPALQAGSAEKTQNIFDQALALLADDALPTAKALAARRTTIHNALLVAFPDYALLIQAMVHYLNTLPVASAMAGVYTAVDGARGVWKAPANVGLNGVVTPTVNLSDAGQESLNIDAVSGKSINAIRAFRGLGVLVWGARTLDGNSQDWRYVNVRRTMIMIEQSVKLAAHSYVFEPNDANTWSTVKSMINSFLFSLWKQGALAGTVPADAYQVVVGLGSTMTADDVLNGYLNVTVLVAIARPAEFIALTFRQQMQKS